MAHKKKLLFPFAEKKTAIRVRRKKITGEREGFQNLKNLYKTVFFVPTNAYGESETPFSSCSFAQPFKYT